MKSIFILLAIALSNLTGSQRNFQQYNKKQIDSIFEVNRSALNFEQSIKQASKAYNASKAINYQEGVARALLVYATIYSNARQHQYAFKYAVEAENAAIEINNPDFEAHALFIEGLTYNYLGFYEDGRKTLLKGISVAQNIEDADKRHYRLANIDNALGISSEPQDAIVYYKKSCSELIKMKKQKVGPGSLGQAINNLASVYVNLKQYDSAGFYLNKALILTVQEKDSIAIALTYSNLGVFYYRKKQYAASEISYLKGIDFARKFKNAFTLKNLYSNLSELYTTLNEKEKARKSLEIFDKLSDSLSNADKLAVQTPLNYIVQYKERQLDQNKKRYLRVILLTCFLLIISACAAFYFYGRFRKKLKLTTEKMNDLVAKIQMNEDKRSPAKIEELKAVVQLAVNNDPAFITKFNQYDAEFSRKLLKLAPSLVASETEFCALLRLSFETKEIARYTRASVRAVEAKKHRIRKKLNIPSDQDINIWMSHI